MTSAELVKLIDNHLSVLNEHQRRNTSGGVLLTEARDHLRDLLTTQQARTSEVLDLTAVHDTLRVGCNRNSTEHHRHAGVVFGLRAALNILNGRH